MILNPIDNKPFTEADVDRILGLADSFLEDWEQHEGRGDPECAERRREFDALRPLLLQAPALLALRDAVEKFIEAEGTGDLTYSANYQTLADAYYDMKGLA